MSTDKDQSQEIKIQTNIIKFPNVKENETIKTSEVGFMNNL